MDDTPLAAAHAPPAFVWCESFIGTRVKLQGLSRAELNGLVGVVEKYDERSGRIGVRLANHEKALAIKPINALPILTHADQPHLEQLIAAADTATAAESPATTNVSVDSDGAVSAAAPKTTGPGYDTCPVCSKPLLAAELNLKTLACGHMVHLNCWDATSTLAYVGNLALRGSEYSMNRDTPELRCPVCGDFHGPASASTKAIQQGAIARGHGHETSGHGSRSLGPGTTWFHGGAQDVLHQLLGFAFQHERMQRTGMEGTVSEETIFITQCRNRLQKARGGVQALDALDAAMHAAALACPDLVKDPTARPPRATMVALGDAVAACSVLCLCETKKAKVLSPKDADKWLDCVKRWLRTAGMAGDEIAAMPTFVAHARGSVACKC
jgi:hypothetical protein